MLLVVCAPSRYQVRGPRRSNCVRPGHSVSRSPGGGEQGSPTAAAARLPFYILPLQSSTRTHYPPPLLAALTAQEPLTGH